MSASIQVPGSDLFALEVKDLGKRFRMFQHPLERISYGLGRGRHLPVDKWALRHINIAVARGESYGIIGRNGSGKSTLLKLICGVMQPTEGTVSTFGRVLGLLELGTGFNLELSGRKNVFASATLLGLPESYARDRLSDIENFADLGDFFDYPVKLYSSGMLVRLAFSLYLFLEPDLLIIDEALSVGDHFFQQKCVAALEKIRLRGTTLLFVSHSLGSVKAMCDRAVLLDHGTAAISGNVDDVIRAYLLRTTAPVPGGASTDGAASSVRKVTPADKVDHNLPVVADAESLLQQLTRDLAPAPGIPVDAWEPVAARFTGSDGHPNAIFEVGAPMQLQVLLTGPRAAQLPQITVEILDRFERIVTGRQVQLKTAQRLAHGEADAVVVIVSMKADIYPGEYVARISVQDRQEAIPKIHVTPTVSIYNRRPFPPFFGVAGLSARFDVEVGASARLALYENAVPVASGETSRN